MMDEVQFKIALDDMKDRVETYELLLTKLQQINAEIDALDAYPLSDETTFKTVPDLIEKHCPSPRLASLLLSSVMATGGGKMLEHHLRSWLAIAAQFGIKIPSEENS